MSSENWRMKPQTFSDEKSQVYTVTNAPPIIAPIATSIDVHTLANSSLGALLRPQLNIGCYPELPFLLCRLPVGDPLLSRLCADPATLTIVHHEAGWALADNIWNAWMRLEKGLLYVSELLMTSTEQSSCGSSARHAIRNQPHWSHPEDSGYRDLHKTPHGAQSAIRRAHVAFQLLIARCSLAIALWLFPGPRDGHVPEVLNRHYNYQKDEVVPNWIQFLTNKGVPSSWIDALNDSVVSDFSFNLRVGAVFYAKERKPLPITPVLRAANVPVFIWWRTADDVKSCGQSLPFMKSFAPPTPADFFLACQRPPAGKPCIVTVCRHGETRSCPDFSATDQVTPPFGPYQLPGESRMEFFARREKFRPDQARQESNLQMQWRNARTAHAQSGLPPYRRSRVFLWVKAEVLFPDLPPRWHGQEYRYAIPPSAYRSIWMVHPAGCRQYNAFFDDWDLWFPNGWGVWHADILSESLSPTIATGEETSRLPVAPVTTSRPIRLNGGDVYQLLAVDTSLLAAAPEDEKDDMVFPSNFHLSDWYGISITDTRTFPGLDYTTWVMRLPQIFSELAMNLPFDIEHQGIVAGWVSAMLAGDLRSRALMHTWDLDARNSAFLLGDGKLRSRMSMEHHRAPKHVQDIDNIFGWVEVKLRNDGDDISWSIFTTAMGALWLARRLADGEASREAVNSLVSVGVPFRTATLLNRPPPLPYALPLASRRRMLPPWRYQGHRPVVQDYVSYCERVLELAASPHARAAWLKGGIVWCIMRHVTGRETPLTNQEDVADGPSIMTANHLPVTIDKMGEAYYDDGLSLEELDVIAGVVKVYTGLRSQTEDASWWPRHSAWVRAGAYTGIWTPWQEHWFLERHQGILAGRERPLNGTEWKDRLKGFKKAGLLADRVDKASWDFTFRNFVQPTRAQ